MTQQGDVSTVEETCNKKGQDSIDNIITSFLTNNTSKISLKSKLKPCAEKWNISDLTKSP